MHGKAAQEGGREIHTRGREKVAAGEARVGGAGAGAAAVAGRELELGEAETP